MSADSGVTGGHLAEMGWGDADGDTRWAGAAGTAVMLCIAGAYWGSVWLVSGLAPIAMLASRLGLKRVERD